MLASWMGFVRTCQSILPAGASLSGHTCKQPEQLLRSQEMHTENLRRDSVTKKRSTHPSKQLVDPDIFVAQRGQLTKPICKRCARSIPAEGDFVHPNTLSMGEVWITA